MVAMKESHETTGAPRRAASPARAWRVVAALLLLPSALPAQRAALERRIQRTTLANGLDVIVV